MKSNWITFIRNVDPEAYNQLQKKYGNEIPKVLYYNKGL